MAVVTDRAVPVRIRRALNIESGLNDGIATPFVTVFLAALLSEEGFAGGSWILEAAMSRPRDPGRRRGRRARRPSPLDGVTPRMDVPRLRAALRARARVSPTWGRWRSAGTDSVSAFSAGLIFGAVAKHHREAIGFTEDASPVRLVPRLGRLRSVVRRSGAHGAGRRVRDRLRGAQPDPGSHAARRGRPRGEGGSRRRRWPSWGGSASGPGLRGVHSSRWRSYAAPPSTPRCSRSRRGRSSSPWSCTGSGAASRRGVRRQCPRERSLRGRTRTAR